MSRWFEAHTRRGGRVHRDQLPPRLVAELQRQAASYYRRRAAIATGARLGKVALGVVLLIGLTAALLLMFGGGR